MRPIRRRPRFGKLAYVLVSTLLIPDVGLAQDEPPPDEGEAEEIPAQDASPPAPSEAKPSGDEESDAEELELEDVSRKAPKGKGVIWGVVTDTKFNEPIIEAPVEVVGHKYRAFTDVEGRYRLELPPGTYVLRVFYELHQPARIERISVGVGQVQQLDIKLVPDENAVEELVVEEEADKTSTEGQTLQRRRAATVGDGVGRAEIARTPDRNAAEAAQRVVGATIVDGRFVYVRGLGERYTNALLNGTPLPSPEPDRQTVPLDLFPSLVLDSITITKTFTPDMPGDFAGGSVGIHTREFPRQTLFQVSLSAGFNTETTFRDRPSYQGSSTDWLGFDAGARQLPDLPKKRLDPNTVVDGNRVTTDDELFLYGRKVNSRMSSRPEFTPPNHGASIVAGDSVKLGKDQKLGVVTALNYGRSYNLYHDLLRNYRAESGGGVIKADDIEGQEGVERVRWGAFGSASYELTSNHRFNVTALHSQSSDDRAAELEGFYENTAGTYHTTHLEFTSRALNFGQVRGTHRLPFLNRAEIDWHLALAAAYRDQPDTRDNDYTKTDTSYVWSPGPTSGAHFFSKQEENTIGGGLDLTQPLTTGEQETKLKFGGLVTQRDRHFNARRFVLEPVGGRALDNRAFDPLRTCAGTSYDTSCPDKLFRADNIRPGLLILRETTIQFDEYEAGLDVHAGYGMIDSQITKAVRVIGGVRAEVTDQRFIAYDPFARAGSEREAKIEQTDWLPALSLVFAASSKSNTRFGVSQTLARPQLREIAPFLSSSYTGSLPAQGNPDLELTKITNADMRFEFFPTMREVLAFSVFYKHFEDPIEEVISRGGQSGIITYQNADSAELIGVELESRKSLEFLQPALKDFSLITNLTLAKSRVDLGARGFSTNASRPLSYQSPFIVNVSLDYSNAQSGTDLRLLYNVFGRRITTVGLGGLPDIYEQPRHLLDLTVAQKLAKHFEVKLQAQNLLDVDVLYTQGEKVEDDSGNTVHSWSPGSTYTLTATYTY